MAVSAYAENVGSKDSACNEHDRKEDSFYQVRKGSI